MATTITYSGTTVTLHLKQDILKSKVQRFSKKFIPGASKLVLEAVGGEGVEVKIGAYLTGASYLTDKDSLNDWHNNAVTVTYDDSEGSLTCKITEFNWTLPLGVVNTVEVSLTLNEV